MPFRDITGHRNLLGLIADASKRGSLPPSLIFAGPDGVGKRMVAIALAQLVNCLAPVPYASLRQPAVPGAGASRHSADPVAQDACGLCTSCLRIARGVHGDVLLVEPGDTGSIRLDQVRDAIDRAAYRPFEGRRRVVIVDEADLVLTEAQNALLKTLEEPPGASMFVLVTARPDLLLATVRSRCQHLRFGRLAPAEVAEVLMRSHGYAAAEAHAAASSSDGSIGAALAVRTEEFVTAREAATRLLQSVLLSGDPRRRLDGARALAAGGSDRDELTRRLRALASMLRDLTVLRSRADERCLANTDLKPLLERLLDAFGAERTLGAFAAVDQALAALDRNASPKIVADWVAFQV